MMFTPLKISFFDESIDKPWVLLIMFQCWVGRQLKAVLHSLSLASPVKAFSYSLCKYCKRSCAILLPIKRLIQLLMELKGHLLWLACPSPIGKLQNVWIQDFIKIDHRTQRSHSFCYYSNGVCFYLWKTTIPLGNATPPLCKVHISENTIK